MPRTRPISDVIAVHDLESQGLSDREVAAATGVPVDTIRDWRRRGLSPRRRRELAGGSSCTVCGCEPHDFSRLPTETYSYLLGVYLGDGCVCRSGFSWSLRIALDTAYPGIIESCMAAVAEILGRQPPAPRAESHAQACVRIESTWKQWPCLFPQHGPGRKHERTIELAPWQRAIVEWAPGPFLRGLIHTDGWRGVNRVHLKGKDYEYPRYQFSNRSDDIRKLFTDACDLMGVSWRPWTSYHVSVAQRESVALLDAVIGPKR